MEQNLDKKTDIKNKFLVFYNNHRLKFIFLILSTLFFFVILIFLQEKQKKSNILISNKYAQAIIFLSSGQKAKAKDYFEEIIFSKNKFYSLLSLNIILDKELIKEDNKIEKYFNLIFNLDLSQNQKDLLLFKKSLYLINKGDTKGAKDLLKESTIENSKLKSFAEDLIKDL